MGRLSLSRYPTFYPSARHFVKDFVSTLVRKLAGCSFVPILMLTTESQAEKKDAGRKAGATGWIVKPLNAEQLISVIQKLVK